MFALLPLIGGLLLGRFTAARVAIPVQVVLYAVAATVLMLTASEHNASDGGGLEFALALAPLSALTLFLGWAWRRRTTRAVRA